VTGQPDDPIVRLLSMLLEGNVEFVVVGGAAAVLSGVPIVTKDLDIVHSRSPENVERLLSALSKLDAHFRPDFAQRKLRPRESDLTGHGHLSYHLAGAVHHLGAADPAARDCDPHRIEGARLHQALSAALSFRDV
jgi:hypothetical protein